MEHDETKSANLQARAAATVEGKAPADAASPRFQWIKEDDGTRGRIVTRAAVEDVVKASSDAENVPTRTVDTSSDTNTPPGWQALQNAVFSDEDIYVMKRRKEEVVFDDNIQPPWKPMEVEEAVWNRLRLRCWEPGPKDKAAFEAELWAFHVAIAFIAGQSQEAAIDNIAAHRWWKGRTIRDARRSSQIMNLAEAVEALRLGLEAGRLHARRSSVPGAKIIPAEEWPDLEWQKSAHDELLEFDKLLHQGKVRYRRPVLLREDVIGLVWTIHGPHDRKSQGMTIAKEVQLEKELISLMKSNNPIPKKDLKKRHVPPLSSRAFDRAWSNAIKLSGQSAWGKAGRRKGSPSPNHRT